jgi:predicted nucleotidyltransferase
MPSAIQEQFYSSVTLFSRDETAIQNALHQLVAELSQRPEVMAVILFGSQARSATSVDSDVDLLLILSDHDQPFLQRLAYYRPETFPVDVDLFPYTIAEIAAGQPLAQTAMATGRPLWQRPGFTLVPYLSKAKP